MKKIFFLFIIYLSTVSCQTLDEAGKILRNEKITNTDEFLVKKKDPLIMPPNYEDVPKPESIKDVKKEKKDIKKILRAPENNNSSSIKNSTTEESIINKIKKK
tara:strand:+ start:90 stop:398 length:309 start_codon:yes stop_codon:yes gene_type:complete